MTFLSSLVLFVALLLIGAGAVSSDPVFGSAKQVSSEEKKFPVVTSFADTKGWPLVGQARLRVLFWDVYDSELYTPNGSWLSRAPYRLEITYLRDISSVQLIEETEKAWKTQGRSHPSQALWLEALSDIWPDVSSGDKLTLWVDQKFASVFYFNLKPIGAIADPDFGELFGGIWLAEDSPRPILRNKLTNLE